MHSCCARRSALNLKEKGEVGGQLPCWLPRLRSRKLRVSIVKTSLGAATSTPTPTWEHILHSPTLSPSVDMLGSKLTTTWHSFSRNQGCDFYLRGKTSQ